MDRAGGRPGRHRIDGVQDPASPDGKIIAWLSVSDLEKIYKHSRVKWFNVRIALEVLCRPRRIYRGIRAEECGERSGWCFVGRPSHWRDADDRSRPAPDNRLFAVYVSEEKDVIEWGVEDQDPADPEKPMDRGGNPRFGDQQWPKI